VVLHLVAVVDREGNREGTKTSVNCKLIIQEIKAADDEPFHDGGGGKYRTILTRGDRPPI